MSVKKEASGRRSVQVEVEVPGTPEEVWQAIATGPGISSWFVPAKFEEQDGKPVAVTLNFGPGMESVAKIRLWDPPRRFVLETTEEPGTIATEWTVEARSGGTCVVRVLHRWFASTDDWDKQFEGHAEGWASFFRILRLYLEHFRGELGSQIQLTGWGTEPKAKAWEAFMGQLGFAGPAVGQRVKTGGGAPSLAGVVERVGDEPWPEELLLRLDQPAPAIAHLFAMPMGGQVFLSVRFYLYGETAASAVARAEPLWQDWLTAQFAPAPLS